MTSVAILVAILGLALLMVVHESGHHLVARAFKMRVLRFSIGFGPPLWKHQPEGSDTVYQVALIPFMAYVQIDGMNPFEESDPEDAGSYANATLTARILTIFAGPLANYLFASVLFFVALLMYGKPSLDPHSTRVQVIEDTPAAAAQMQDGDTIVSIDGEPVKDFEQMRDIIIKHPNEALEVGIEREGRPMTLAITPEPRAQGGGGQIGVRPQRTFGEMSLKEAAIESIERPALVVRDLVVGLARMVMRPEKTEVAGPVQIVKYGALMVEAGPYDLLAFLAKLSAYLGGFNLLPVPALDGGRLIFLGYEAVARRKPNAKLEAQIHMFGLLMFLALIAVVTVHDFQR
jgi:regulator of sigma E protease